MDKAGDIENKYTYWQKQQTKVEVDFQKILIPFAIDVAKKKENGQKQRHVAGKITSNESSERSPLKR